MSTNVSERRSSTVDSSPLLKTPRAKSIRAVDFGESKIPKPNLANRSPSQPTSHSSPATQKSQSPKALRNPSVLSPKASRIPSAMSPKASRIPSAVGLKTPGSEDKHGLQDRKPKPSPPTPPPTERTAPSPKVTPGKTKVVSPRVSLSAEKKSKEASSKMSATRVKSPEVPKKGRETPQKAAMASKKDPSTLCLECRTALDGAVCYIGNDGRVSAASTRTVRHCKRKKCANYNAEFAAFLAELLAGPKKAPPSRRHSVSAPSTARKSAKPMATMNTEKPSSPEPAGSSEVSRSENVDVVGNTEINGGFDYHNGHADFHSSEELLESDVNYSHSEQVEVQHEAEAEAEDAEDDYPNDDDDFTNYANADAEVGGQRRTTGHARVRRRSFSLIEKQGLEAITLKKQMLQERKNAEEWMLDYAIEEALQKLAPKGESKVKALVEAFESIIPNKPSEPHDHITGPKTPEKC